MDRLPNTSMGTVSNYNESSITSVHNIVSNNIVDNSYTRVIISDKYISNNALDILPNTSMLTVSNNIVDTRYSRFIMKWVYVLMLWTDYQTHQWTLYQTILWTLVILDSS